MIHIVLGTKAQLIKMAPIMRRLQDREIPYNFIHTGQHQATMPEMLTDFGLKEPDVLLHSGSDIVSLSRMFGWIVRILWKTLFCRQEIFKGQQGVVLVHGDTFSTLLGALMGRLAGLRVGHVESGLRSFNLFHPFPEEITRLLVFRLSHILYCPGQWAVDNVAALKKEKVNIRANTLVDTLAMTLKKNQSRSAACDLPDHPFALVSLHRYENIFKEKQLSQLVEYLESIALRMSLLFILHPATEKQLHRFQLFSRIAENPNIECRPRYPHSDFVALLTEAEFVVTDGGSLQEEASYLGIPCLLLRKATERREGLGENVLLSGYDPRLIDEFTDHYRDYARTVRSSRESPSDIVIDSALGHA